MVAISRSRVKARNPYASKQQNLTDVLKIVLAVLVGACLLLKLVTNNAGVGGVGPDGYAADETGSSLKARFKRAVRDHRPHLNLDSKSSPGLSEFYNAQAQDILKTLDCVTLLNRTTSNAANSNYNDNMRMGDGGGPSDDGLDNTNNNNNNQDTMGQQQQDGNNNNMRRRLQDEGVKPTDDGDDNIKQDNIDMKDSSNNNNNNGDGGGTDDGANREFMDDFGGEYGGYYEEVTAKEAFCLAAATTTISEDMVNKTKARIKCDAAGTRQIALLDLWSAARAQMTEAVLIKTLELATETGRSIGNRFVNLWAPRTDDGMNYILNQVSDQQESARNNGNNFFGLSNNLGPGHLFVDVGSCLGITTLAVILEYPKTKVVSIEPAAPNWLMQELNMKCNLEEDEQPTVLLAGVGPHTRETMAAKLLWRPSSVTATRAWTSAKERNDEEDEELMVQLRPWKTILAEADVPSSRHIDVLHVDCEGCEYNLIPALSESEYESIDTVMGELHWGYMPEHKLPSSKRGQLTHDRLCQHENFARTAKECCGNLDKAVRSFNPGEVLYRDNKPNEVATVKDLINDGLCDDFSVWSEEHHFYTIDNDYGWFEMTSVAK